MKHQLLNRWNNSCVIFEAEFDDLGTIGKNRGELLRRAVLRRAVLRRADLTGADLTDADLTGAVLTGADLTGAVLTGAVLRRAVLTGAVLTDAVLRCADLTGAVLTDAVLTDAVLTGAVLTDAGKIRALRAFHGVYQYTILIMVAEDMTPWIWMGCQHRTVAEWDAMEGGIRDSRPGEFPNNGSTTSERRARAYEFARAEVMHMVEEEKAKDAATRN